MLSGYNQNGDPTYSTGIQCKKQIWVENEKPITLSPYKVTGQESNAEYYTWLAAQDQQAELRRQMEGPNSGGLINSDAGRNPDPRYGSNSTIAGGPPLQLRSSGVGVSDVLGAKVSVDATIPFPNPFGPRGIGSNRVMTWSPIGVHFDATLSKAGLEGDFKMGVGTPRSIGGATGVAIAGGLNLRLVGDYNENTNWSISGTGGRGFGGAVEAGFNGTELRTLDVTLGFGYGAGATVGVSQWNRVFFDGP